MCIVWVRLFSYYAWFPSGARLFLDVFICFCSYSVRFVCVCVTHRKKDTGRLTIPYEVFINVCLTCADAGCIPVNQCRGQKIIQNQLTDRSYHLQLSLTCQSNKCSLQRLSQIIWHLKAGSCQSRKNGERGSVGLFGPRPSGLFWPVFQRSTVWLSYHNYFSRTNLFIGISMSTGLLIFMSLHPKQAKMAGDALCLPELGKNIIAFLN